MNIKETIRRELPGIMREDPEIRAFVLNIVSTQFADKKETESRFDRIMEELRRDREEQSKKWEEQNKRWAEQSKRWAEQSKRWEEQDKRWAEQSKRWEEQDKRWAEQNKRLAEQNKRWEEQDKRWVEQDKKWEENQKVIRKLFEKIDTGIGALGARWGIQAEESFRNGLKGILEESFGVEVLNVVEFDEAGEVFGAPDQVEIDIIVKDRLLILCEIKSSMSRGDVYLFGRKIAFYEKRHNRKADRKMIISPMVDKRGRRVAEKLNIEVYSSSVEILGI